MATNNIHYIFDSDRYAELIFCENSTISYPTHNHVSTLTIGIVLDGSILLATNHDVKTYEKNQSFIIYPYIPHSIMARNTYTLLSVCIDKNFATHSPANEIKHNILTLLASALNIEILNQYHILQLFDSLNSFADDPNQHSDNQNPFIDNWKKNLELHPEKKMSVDEMAQDSFISKYHFIRNFKAEVGLTPHQFQLQNRIRKAQRLIHSSETITETALATGFCDQSHFINQFKKQVGLTPLAYKLSSRIIKTGESNQHNAGINFANRFL